MGRHRSETNFIFFEQGCELVNAALWAFCIGMWLNRFLTIHLDKAELRPHHHRFVTQYMKSAGDWLRARTGGKPCYIYVFENPPEGGLHVHILMHVPIEHWVDFVRASQRWLRRHLKRYNAKYFGRILRNSGILSHSAFVKGDASVFDYLRDFRQVLRYMLKGSELRSVKLVDMLANVDFDPEIDPLPDLVDVPDLDLSSIHVSGQGAISGKRSGYAELLGPSRRVYVRHGSVRHPKIILPSREERAEHLLSQVGLVFPKRPTLILPEPLSERIQPITNPLARTNARIISGPSGDCASAGGSNGRQ